MPTLGDYLGTLLAEVVNARVQADMETARVAQVYATHPLLKHMAVPRFRLPELNLDFPVAVERVDEAAPAGAQRHVRVIVATDKLRNAPLFALTRINLKITEEAMEWAETKPGEESSRTLLPE